MLSGGSPLSEEVRQTLDDNNLRSQQSSDAPLDTCVDIGTQSSTSGGGPPLESVHQASCITKSSTQALMSGGSPLFESAHPDAGVQASLTSPENNGGTVLKSAQDVHAVYPLPVSVSGGCPPRDSSRSSDSTVEGRLIHLKHMPTISHSSPTKPSSQGGDVYLAPQGHSECELTCMKTDVRWK